MLLNIMKCLIKSKKINGSSYSKIHYHLMKKKILDKAVKNNLNNNYSNISDLVLFKNKSKKEIKLKSKKSKFYKPSKLRHSVTKKGRFFIYNDN